MFMANYVISGKNLKKLFKRKLSNNKFPKNANQNEPKIRFKAIFSLIKTTLQVPLNTNNPNFFSPLKCKALPFS